MLYAFKNISLTLLIVIRVLQIAFTDLFLSHHYSFKYFNWLIHCNFIVSFPNINKFVI